MATGTIKFFDEAKGYGFIIPDGVPGQSDIYLHRSALQWAGIQKLDRGQKVFFEIASQVRTGRPAARNLKLIIEAEA
jgi:cold shock protein